MPIRFPEFPGIVFLTFREVWDGLPVAGKKHVWWNGFQELEPYALWESSESPHVPRPVHPDWLRFPHWWFDSKEESAESLYTRNQLNVHDGPDGPLHLYFDRKTVTAFKKAGAFAPVPDVEFPSFLGPHHAKGGRGSEVYLQAIREATARKGGQLTPEEGLQAIRDKGMKPKLEGADFYVDGVRRSKRTFTNALSKAARELHRMPRKQ